MTLYLFRTLTREENGDDEAEPVAWGALRAESEAEALALVDAYLVESIGARLPVMLRTLADDGAKGLIHPSESTRIPRR